MAHLEKAKAALPAKPVKAKAPKVAKVAPQPEVQPEPEDLDEPQAPPTKDPAKSAVSGKRKVLGKKVCDIFNSLFSFLSLSFPLFLELPRRWKTSNFQNHKVYLDLILAYWCTCESFVIT